MDEQSERNAPIIIDLGKKKNKTVKKLRKGQGALMDDIRDAIEELESAGTVSKDAQPVIVIVEAKPPKSGWSSWM